MLCQVKADVFPEEEDVVLKRRRKEEGRDGNIQMRMMISKKVRLTVSSPG